MQQFGRRRFLKSAAVLGAATAAGSIPVLATAEAEEEQARAERVTFLVPDLDPAHDGLRVAQLSDVHVGRQTSPRRHPPRRRRGEPLRARPRRPHRRLPLPEPWRRGEAARAARRPRRAHGRGAREPRRLGGPAGHRARPARPRLRGARERVDPRSAARRAVRRRGRRRPPHREGRRPARPSEASRPGAAPLVLAHGPRTADRLARARPAARLPVGAHARGADQPPDRHAAPPREPARAVRPRAVRAGRRFSCT